MFVSKLQVFVHCNITPIKYHKSVPIVRSMTSSKHHNPLELLRSHFMSQKRPKLKDRYITFEKDIRLPISTMTAWQSPLTNMQYSLGSLYVLLEAHVNKQKDYMSKVAEVGVEMVNIVDREEIHQYFTGKITETKHIKEGWQVEEGNLRSEKEISSFRAIQINYSYIV